MTRPRDQPSFVREYPHSVEVDSLHRNHLPLYLLSKESMWIIPAKLLIKSIQRKKIQSQSYYSRAGFRLLVEVWISKICLMLEVGFFICQSSRYFYRAYHIVKWGPVFSCQFLLVLLRSNNFWSVQLTFLPIFELGLSMCESWHFIRNLLSPWTMSATMCSNLEVKKKSPCRSRWSSIPLHLWVGWSSLL